MHSSLFRQTMEALGLDGRYGAYLDSPGPTLATVNLMSLFGLHRRWRGASWAPPGGHGDDLHRAQPPLRQRAAPARLRPPGHRVLRRARGGRCGARQIAAHLLAGSSPSKAPRWRATCSSAPGRCSSWTGWSAHQLAAWRAGRSSLGGRFAVARAA